MDDLVQSLTKAGLTDKEARVYLALLKVGRGTAYQIAGVADIKIPTTYVILDELRKKDLALKIPNVKRQIFMPRDPDEFLSRLRGNFLSIERVIPKLNALAKKRDESKTLTFDGYAGIRQSLDYKIDSMLGKEFLAFYSDSTDADKKIVDIYDKWNRGILKKNTITKVIAPNAPETIAYAKEMPEKYNSQLKLIDIAIFETEISIEIGETFVRIISMKDIQATVVDNIRVADAMRKIFFMVWDHIPGKIWKA